jgi:hypothetical protein
VRLGDVLFAALGLLLLVTAVRFRAAAALLLLPLIARRSPGEAAARPGLERWLGLALLTLGLPATWLWAVGQHPGRAPGLGLDADRFPVEAAALLKDQGATGHLYNFYDDGGYLVWQLAPAVQVAIDGRTPTFHSPEHHALWRQSCRSLRTFEGMDARWGIDHALVQRDLPLCGRLADHPGWRAVHIDPRRVLFTRADGPLLPGVKLGDSGLCTW